MKTLDEGGKGEIAEIEKVVEGPLSSKLADMGIYPGRQVRVLYKAPLGDPIAVEVGDFTLSLRIEEAALIEVMSVE